MVMYLIINLLKALSLIFHKNSNSRPKIRGGSKLKVGLFYFNRKIGCNFTFESPAIGGYFQK